MLMLFFKWQSAPMEKGKKHYLLLFMAVNFCPAIYKKDSSLLCKASGRALLPRLLRTDVQMRLIALQ